MINFLKKIGEAILVIIFGAMLIVAVILAEFNQFPLMDMVIDSLQYVF